MPQLVYFTWEMSFRYCQLLLRPPVVAGPLAFCFLSDSVLAVSQVFLGE